MDRLPRLTFKRLTGPAAEPLTPAEAKSFARIDTDYDDTLVTSLIVRAREHCEAITQRQFITATYRLLLDEFPTSVRKDTYRVTERSEGTDILLPRPNLISVESIVYLDENNVSQTVSSSDYIVSTDDEPGRIALAYQAIWPFTYPQINAVTISYTAGYGATAAAVPEGIKQAMSMLIAHWYENREATVNFTQLPREYDFSVKALLRPFCVSELWQGSLE